MTTTAPPDGRTAAELVALRRRLAQLERLVGVPAPAPLAAPPTGYRLVEPDDVVQADDHNLVMNQAAPRFPNADARDAEILAPDPGMLSYLVDLDQVQRWATGRGWQPVAGALPFGEAIWGGGTWPGGSTWVKGTSAPTTRTEQGGLVVSAADGHMSVAHSGLYLFTVWSDVVATSAVYRFGNAGGDASMITMQGAMNMADPYVPMYVTGSVVRRLTAGAQIYYWTLSTTTLTQTAAAMKLTYLQPF